MNRKLQKERDKDISSIWDVYSHQQQEVILSEFRKKFPNNYYCKTTLLEFLLEKFDVVDQETRTPPTILS